MITDWTTPFIEAKAEYVAWLGEQEYPTYRDLLQKALEIVVRGKEDSYRNPLPDPERIHAIDDGDYQGTRVFVVAAQGYQPFDYWYTKVSYGSCSGCDSLLAAWDYGHESDYGGLWLLALHMLQRAKRMDDDGGTDT